MGSEEGVTPCEMHPDVPLHLKEVGKRDAAHQGKWEGLLIHLTSFLYPVSFWGILFWDKKTLQLTPHYPSLAIFLSFRKIKPVMGRF